MDGEKKERKKKTKISISHLGKGIKLPYLKIPKRKDLFRKIKVHLCR